MLRYATETYYQNKIARQEAIIARKEAKIEKLKAKLKELNVPEEVLREFADDELF